MKTTVVVAVVLAVLMATLCSTAWCQGGPKGPPQICAALAILPPPAGAFDQIAKLLELTNDQALAVKTIMTSYDENMAVLIKATADANKAVRDAVLAEAFDADTVRDLAAGAQAAESALLHASIDAWTQLRTVLTSEQVARLMAGPPPPGRGGGGPPPPGGGKSGTGTGRPAGGQR